MCSFTAHRCLAKSEAGQSAILELLHLIWEIWSKEQGPTLDSTPRSTACFLYDLGHFTVNPGHHISIERCINIFESLHLYHIVPQFPIC